jgi:hypothetical protein
MHNLCQHPPQAFSKPIKIGFHESRRIKKIVFHPCSSVPSVVKIRCFLDRLRLCSDVKSVVDLS